MSKIFEELEIDEIIKEVMLRRRELFVADYGHESIERADEWINQFDVDDFIREYLSEDIDFRNKIIEIAKNL